MKKGVRSRFEKSMDELALKFSSSMDDDRNIFYYDILVDLAHVLGLYHTGVLYREDASEIVEGLLRIRDEGFENLSKDYEDVHEAIEARLIELTEKGAKMHTGRSRNDEVATCLRLFARDRMLSILFRLIELRSVVLDLAVKHLDSLIPGFTHMQYAQPNRLAHHLLAYHDALKRDFDRILDSFWRVNLSPLGGSAFASTSFKLDRDFTANLLGFDGIVENSMDAVASRDFLIEAVFDCSSLMLNLSRICEELILWSSEFNFVELSDELSSTSSIMPQKKNPDIAELIRARAARVCGNLNSAMMIYKAMPYAYNRDFQEMNPLLYFSLESAEVCTILVARMLESAKFRTGVMKEKISKGFLTATEIADMLVQKANIPFRVAHRIVGWLAMNGRTDPTLNDLVEAVKEVAEEYLDNLDISEEDLNQAKNAVNALERRKNRGSPSREEVEKMINSRIEALNKDYRKVDEIADRISASLEKLYSLVSELVT
ncbi:argininosuccinate lyase [Archaeoglobus sulfaticallidus PM70-1]|uniref:Argininosuccinate lyase n=1 Tax=Archaeoglobus sulfaticallidus PM70-1 TaxID=387631 RepID=N0BFI4_9EURY|nr:argininosuccinate lyase [Archaeoglobus sulfaticallidus]AGK61002.1 argininosuccinate lyase [Archaeoglobus sulfaticallidus PM70-1]